MTKAELEAGIGAKALMDAIPPGTKVGERDAFLEIASLRVFPSDLESFAALLSRPGFRTFLGARLGGSKARLEALLDILLGKLVSGTGPDTVSLVAESMAGERFRLVERSFFFAPPDREACALFDRAYGDVAFQSDEGAEAFLGFCSSGLLKSLRSAFSDEVYRALHPFFASLSISGRSKSLPVEAAETLLSEAFSGLLAEAPSEGLLRDFLAALLEALSLRRDLSLARRAAHDFARRYPKAGNGRVARFLSVWPALIAMSERRHGSDFRDFLEAYGNRKEDFQDFVWNLTFNQEPGKALKAVSLFASSSFKSIVAGFSHRREILRLLVTNVFAILTETELRDLGLGVYPIILKLLLKLRPEEGFLERRARFFAWVKERTSSTLVELELVRVFLFEYVFLATGIVPRRRPQVMTKAVGREHSMLVRAVDVVMADPDAWREAGEDATFGPVLEAFRDLLWSGVAARFPEREYAMAELRAASESLDAEDEAIAGLSALEPEFIDEYRDAFMELYARTPEASAQALSAGYWRRVRLEDAMPHVTGAVIPAVGLVPVRADPVNPEPGLAYTDGSTITLPAWIDWFPDAKDPIDENRNLSLYVALALHEAGHLIGGTFAIDARRLVAATENPRLYSFIHNVFEDYRVEKFLKVSGVHPQAAALLDGMNEWFSARNFALRPPGRADATDLLMWMSDSAAGTNSLLLSDPAYSSFIGELFASALPTGRFRSVRELAEYGRDRLAAMDIRNLAATHVLAREFHDALRHWPECFSLDSAGRFGPKAQNPAGAEGGNRIEISDRDALKGLYEACDADPESVLGPLGLGILARSGERRPPPGNGHGSERAAGEMIGRPKPDYTTRGFADATTRTRLDDLLAEDRANSGPGGVDGKGLSFGGGKKSGAGSGKRKVRSLDPRTKSRTRLGEISLRRVSGTDRGFLARMGRWEAAAARVRALLAELVPKTAESRETSATEGDVDMEALVELLASGEAGKRGEFLETWLEDARADFDAVVGLDVSGSTALEVSPGVSVIDVEKAFALIFGEALERLSGRVRYLAFDSATATNVYEAATLQAVSSFAPGNGNRDGDFVRFVIGELSRAASPVRYFFLLSDGQPNSVNYAGKEALDDTLAAMRECGKAGIRLVYLNVDAREGEYFRAFAAECSFARHFSSPEDLLPAIPSLVSAIAKGVT